MLEDDDIVRAMRDPLASVRENGVRLAESRIPISPRLIEAVFPLADDADARVRLHAALALGAANDPRSIDVLATIARRDGADRWVRAAIFSSVRDRTSAFLDAFINAQSATPAVRAAVMQDLGRLFGAAESAERCLTLVTEISDPGVGLSWQPAALSGLAAGLRTRGMASETQSALMTLVSADTPQGRVARERLSIQMVRAGELALLDEAPLEPRLSAIELLAQGEWSVSGATLVQLLDPRRQSAIQIAAVRALGQLRDSAAAASLVERARWQAYTPQVRDGVLTTLFSEERLVSVLLDAVARGDISASASGASRWRRLMAHRNTSIRQRAEALSAAADTGNAMQVYERKLKDVVARTGNPTRGAAAFTTYCTVCHTFNGSQGAHVSGQILFEGRDLVALSEAELRAIRRQRHRDDLPGSAVLAAPFFKVGAQLIEALRVHQDITKAQARARTIELLGLVGIPDPPRRVDDYPHEFSGGMRQRAMIAMALANEPKLLIADEPTTALDVTVQAQILALLERLQRELGMAIVIITHDLGVVAEMADEIAVMYAGRIVEGFDGDDLLERTPLHMGPAQVDSEARELARRRLSWLRSPACRQHVNRPVGVSLPPALSLCAAVACAHRPAAAVGRRPARPRGRVPARCGRAPAPVGGAARRAYAGRGARRGRPA